MLENGDSELASELFGDRSYEGPATAYSDSYLPSRLEGCLRIEETSWFEVVILLPG